MRVLICLFMLGFNFQYYGENCCYDKIVNHINCVKYHSLLQMPTFLTYNDVGRVHYSCQTNWTNKQKSLT